MDMQAQVRPGEHAGGLLLIKQLEAHEQPACQRNPRISGQPASRRTRPISAATAANADQSTHQRQPGQGKAGGLRRRDVAVGQGHIGFDCTARCAETGVIAAEVGAIARGEVA